MPLQNGKAIMCAYKLCRVEFKYWGMQAKIERFIHDIGNLKLLFSLNSKLIRFIALRKTMVRAHRQAWTWQDEWINLTMEDIREIERQTQEALAQKMGSASGNSSGVTNTGSTTREESKSPADSPPTPSASNQPLVSPVAQPANLWPISCISESSSDDEEFFDCQGERSPSTNPPD